MLDAVVVGAGQAGLGMAWHLKQNGRSFVVLERGLIGESWRSQRWDSFAVNTPNWMNGLPGAPFEDGPQDGFCLRDELVASFEAYVVRFGLPVKTGVTATEIRPAGGRDAFVVRYEGDSGATEVESRNVVIASGIMQTPRIPASRTAIPTSVLQLHTADYRSPRSLPTGGVVVVGGGQSGCQIVEDLVEGGRTVYLCTSRVGRAPRRHRGRDLLDWWAENGYLAERLADLRDPAISRATQPQISGLGRYGHTVSLQALARRGVHLLGRLQDIRDGILWCADDVAENMRFADQKSADFKRAIDDYIAGAGIDAPAHEPDPADEPDAELLQRSYPTHLDLLAERIGTVIWCTGFGATFDWIRAPVTDEHGRPVHVRGESRVPGLFFLGFPWLHSRQSGLIHGIADDAAFLAQRIETRLQGPRQ